MCFCAFAQTASFTSSKDKDCNILKVTLNAGASQGAAPLTYSWDFGNGNSISGPDKSVVDAVYSNTGSYTASLTVTDANGNKSAVATKVLNVLEGPKIAFNVDNNSSCSGQTISFINTTTPGSSPINGYIWNIGGLKTSSDQNPSFKFEEEGVYDITLTVTDQNQCNVSLKKEKLVTIENKFEVKFASDSSFNCGVGSIPANFKDITNYGQAVGHSFSYLWTFGDGTTSTLQNPFKSYSVAGSYSVTLEITDATDNCTLKESKKDFISVGGKEPALDVVLENKFCTEYYYRMTANSAGLPAYFEKSVDFGDGETMKLGDDEPFKHFFRKAGTYNVKTTYSNPYDPSCKKTGITTIIIPDGGESFTADQLGSCNAPITIKFKPQNISDGLSYQWEFGDGTISNDSTPTKTYTTKGEFSVGLKVFGKKGCSYTIEKKNYIRVGNAKAIFTTDGRRRGDYPEDFSSFLNDTKDTSVIEGGCIPHLVNFKSASTSGAAINNYKWDFGDGTTSTSTTGDFAHTYTVEGIFSPTLTVTDVEGCTDTYTCNNCVKAGKPPVATITMTGPDTVCCTYDKTFAANVNLNDVDFLWYDVRWNDGTIPNASSSIGYYKDATGTWKLVDNANELFPFTPRGLGLHQNVTNFASNGGNEPDFFFYAYKNGCKTKVEQPKYQKHFNPWGSFADPNCKTLENLRPGDTINLNTFAGNWIMDAGQKLAKAEIVARYVNASGTCPSFDSVRTYTSANLGMELTGDVFTQIQKSGRFPKIPIPPCAGIGDILYLDTYLYEADPPEPNKRGKCFCDDHAVAPLFNLNTQPKITVDKPVGCAPLTVNFALLNSTKTTKWLFEDGLVLQGLNPSHTFEKPGVYRFKVDVKDTALCTDYTYTDFISVSGPVAKFGTNETAFCLNPEPGNNAGKELKLTDSSRVTNGTIVKWDWTLGGTLLKSNPNKNDVRYNLTAADIPKNATKTSLAKLTVTDNNGCTSSDSINLIIRTTKPAYTFTRATGCFDTLKVIPLFQNFEGKEPYFGRLYVNYYTSKDTVEVYKEFLFNVVDKPVLLDKNGTYKIKMEINEDSYGSCYSSTTDSVVKTNYNSLEPDFRLTSRTFFNCAPALVDVEDLSLKWKNYDIKTWDWTFKNIATGGEVKGTKRLPDTFSLVDTGYYNASLTIVDQAGCKKTLTKDSVAQISPLVGEILPLKDTVCPGELIMFQGKSNAAAFFWDFGDGLVGNKAIEAHKYNVIGKRIVKFGYQDGSNTCQSSAKDSVYVLNGPVFSLGNDTTVCERGGFLLRGTVNTQYEYKWNTGEVTSSKRADTAGTYALTIKDRSLKCPYTDSIKISTVPLPPVKINPAPPFCKGDPVTVTGTFDNTITDIRWLKNDVEAATSQEFSLNGDDSYKITLKIQDANKCINKDSLKLVMLVKPSLLLNGASFCPGDSSFLKAVPSVDYGSLWKYKWWEGTDLLKKDSADQIQVKRPGAYRVTYSYGNCSVSANASASLFPLPSSGTNPRDFNFCEEEGSVQIDGGIATRYTWLESGASTRYIDVKKVGNYILKIENEFNCFAYDTVIVYTKCSPKLYVPNAFSPNSDEENEVHSIFAYNISNFELQIFNRWGEVIYQTNDHLKPWDGFYRGELMPSGVYPWRIKYSGNNPDFSSTERLEGKVVLVR